MAEILLSLTIIGVVAAITLPSLTGNINERTWNTQRKALYSRISQAISLMPSLNGYGIGATEELTTKNATQTFITEGLAKVLKINNICDTEHLNDCGITDKKITPVKLGGAAVSPIQIPTTLHDLNSLFNVSTALGGESQWTLSYSQVNTEVAAFETVNGESVVVYYYPNCGFNTYSSDTNHYRELIQPTMCVNFMFDLNGKKGPNTIGKDIGFMTGFYPTDTIIVQPNPIAYVKDSDSSYVGRLNQICKNKVSEESRIATKEELMSIFVNKSLMPVVSNGYVTQIGSSYFLMQMYSGKGYSKDNLDGINSDVICVKTY